MNSNLSSVFLKMPHPTQKDYVNIITQSRHSPTGIRVVSKSSSINKLSGIQITFPTETILQRVVKPVWPHYSNL